MNGRARCTPDNGRNESMAITRRGMHGQVVDSLGQSIVAGRLLPAR